MARRRGMKKSRPTKYKSAFNIRQAGKSYIQLGIGTELLFSSNPIEFFGGGFLPGYAGTAQGQNNITAYELFNWTEGKAYSPTSSYGSGLGDTVMYNVRNGAGKAIVSSVGLKVGDKVAQKLGVYRGFNKLVRSVGLGDLVKM
tara:strand:- start:2108 stop:2536 length:429 start_codon:yes stop_codon:yes gene_type:complete